MGGRNTTREIRYPYIPEDAVIKYVPADNEFMRAAKAVAAEASLDTTVPTGSVVVKDSTVIGRGANGSSYHADNICERVRQNIPTGQGYELCEGCHPQNHSEPRAIKDALSKVKDLGEASLYLWGHWWCCEPCWNAILKHGIAHVYLQQDSHILFNKESPDNIIGRQFVASTA